MKKSSLKRKNMQKRSNGKNVRFISAVIKYSKIKIKNGIKSDVEKLIAKKPSRETFA